MSFALTTQQMREGTKTVTRRLGWQFLRPGDVVCAVVKSQGLKRGETVERIGVIRIVDVRREPLIRLVTDATYGFVEVRREGFEGDPEWGTPERFFEKFCETHGIKNGATEVTRIEFERFAL